MTAFGRIIEGLNGEGVRYVLIGGIALIRHGVLRATRDVDGLVPRSQENAPALRRLVDHWEATRPDGSPVTQEDFAGSRSLHLSTPYGALDLMPAPAGGPTFEKVEERAEIRRVDGVPAPICSLADLVALKRMAGRERDVLDLRELEDAHGELPDSRDPFAS